MRAPTSSHHFVNGRPLSPPWPGGLDEVCFAMGCFWGAERLFWQLDGVYVTIAGYQGGKTKDPSYDEIFRKQSGHIESVRAVFDPAHISLQDLLAQFWENHDPTQGARQGNDYGEQYRSMIFTNTAAQSKIAANSMEHAQSLLGAKGFGPITTQIVEGARFWMAEEEHQQYLAKNPGGYCTIGGTGIAYGAPK